MAQARAKVQPDNPDPAQPEDPDSKIMVGGPGQPDPEEPHEPATPSEVEVTIAGRKFALAPETAQAIRQREEEFNRKLNEHSQELGQLRKLAQQHQPRDPAPQEPNDEELMFSNPREWMKRFEHKIETKLTGKYEQEKKLESFWRGFYSRNKDLDPDTDDFMVQAIMNQHWNEIADLTPRQAEERLAELTREELIRVAQKFRPEDKTPTRAVAEPASPARTQTRAKPDDEGPKTLSDVINARRRAKGQKPGIRAA